VSTANDVEICEHCGKNPGTLYEGHGSKGQRRYRRRYGWAAEIADAEPSQDGVSLIVWERFAHYFCDPCIESEIKKGTRRAGTWLVVGGIILLIVALFLPGDSALVGCICPGAAVLVVLFGLSQFVQMNRLNKIAFKNVAYQNAGQRLGRELEKRLKSLKKQSERRDIGQMVSYLKDEHWAVRRDAALALGQSGHPQAVAPLQALLNDATCDIKPAVQEALKMLGR
jgi:hypothetical protein